MNGTERLDQDEKKLKTIYEEYVSADKKNLSEMRELLFTSRDRRDSIDGCKKNFTEWTELFRTKTEELGILLEKSRANSLDICNENLRKEAEVIINKIENSYKYFASMNAFAEEFLNKYHM